MTVTLRRWDGRKSDPFKRIEETYTHANGEMFVHRKVTPKFGEVVLDAFAEEVTRLRPHSYLEYEE